MRPSAEPSSGAAAPALEDGSADGLIDVYVERGHGAREHLIAADHEQELHDLAGREALAERHEGLLLGTWPVEHLRGEAKQHPSVGVEARCIELAALDGRYPLVIDADCLGDADVLDPLVLGTGAHGDEQNRELSQLRVELQLCEQRLAEAQVGNERRIGMGEHGEDVEGRQRLKRPAHARRSLLGVHVGQSGHGKSYSTRARQPLNVDGPESPEGSSRSRTACLKPACAARCWKA